MPLLFVTRKCIPVVTNAKAKGFTLIELIVMILLIGILAAVAIPKYINMQKDAADATAQSILAGMRGAMALTFLQYQLNPSLGRTYPKMNELLRNMDLQGVQTTVGVAGDSSSAEGCTFFLTATISAYTYQFEYTVANNGVINIPIIVEDFHPSW